MRMGSEPTSRQTYEDVAGVAARTTVRWRDGPNRCTAAAPPRLLVPMAQSSCSSPERSAPGGHDSSAFAPIAVIGIGCRFPKAPNVGAYWRMMLDGVDAISEVPADRWDVEMFYDPRPATPCKIVTRNGGFVDHIDSFDPYFFGISPREAVRMDPQQ